MTFQEYLFTKGGIASNLISKFSDLVFLKRFTQGGSDNLTAELGQTLNEALNTLEIACLMHAREQAINEAIDAFKAKPEVLESLDAVVQRLEALK